MQLYFNREDARVEVNEALKDASGDRHTAGEFHDQGGNRAVNLTVLLVLLVVFVFTMKANLSSSSLDLKLVEKKKQLAHTFEFKIPEPEIKKEPPKPKPRQEIPKPKDRRPPTRRHAPEQYATAIKPEKLQDRDMKQDQARENLQEQAVVREVPTVQTPVIERTQQTVRQNVNEQARQVSAVISGDTTRIYAAAGIEVRNAPVLEVSHSELDPYHYQMVSICLRLCVQSLFLRDTGGKQYSADWLRIDKSEGRNRLSIMHRGSWFVLEINKDRLDVLSDISFINIPSDYASRVGDIEVFFESVTKKLCTLLHYEDCMENLN